MALIPNLLDEYDVGVMDTSPDSLYFKVSGLETIYGIGKHVFVIYGSDYLKKGTKILFECMDADGFPVFMCIPKHVVGEDIAPANYVQMIVDKDTADGPSVLSIVGVIETDNPDWKDIYNVKWQKEIMINKNLSNKSQILFKKLPTFEITEKIKPYLTSVALEPITITASYSDSNLR